MLKSFFEENKFWLGPFIRMVMSGLFVCSLAAYVNNTPDLLAVISIPGFSEDPIFLVGLYCGGICIMAIEFFFAVWDCIVGIFRNWKKFRGADNGC